MQPTDYCSAELVDRINVSDTLAVFKFKPDQKLSFTPGQYATVGIKFRDALFERPYSIVSSPLENVLEFFIELVPQGMLSPRLWELKMHSKILIRSRIVGHLTLRPTSMRHLMAATVTGIAPFVSIARTKRLNEKNGLASNDAILILHGASHVKDFGPYQEELESISKEGWLKYVPTISRPWDEGDWHGETGRIEDVLRKYLDSGGFTAGETVAYACGHPNMIDHIKKILLRARFSSDQIHQEEYFATETRSTANKSALPYQVCSPVTENEMNCRGLIGGHAFRVPQVKETS